MQLRIQWSIFPGCNTFYSLCSLYWDWREGNTTVRIRPNEGHFSNAPSKFYLLVWRLSPSKLTNVLTLMLCVRGHPVHISAESLRLFVFFLIASNKMSRQCFKLGDRFSLPRSLQFLSRRRSVTRRCMPWVAGSLKTNRTTAAPGM
jgi:hypothetical protein